MQRDFIVALDLFDFDHKVIRRLCDGMGIISLGDKCAAVCEEDRV
jgi:hypothetical protein